MTVKEIMNKYEGYDFAIVEEEGLEYWREYNGKWVEYSDYNALNDNDIMSLEAKAIDLDSYKEEKTILITVKF